MRLGVVLPVDRMHGVAEQARDGQRITGAAAPQLDDEAGVARPQSATSSIDDDLMREGPAVGDGELAEAEQLHEIEEGRSLPAGCSAGRTASSARPPSAAASRARAR